MFCPNCGTQIKEQDLFCPNCGTKNKAAQPPVQAQYQQSQAPRAQAQYSQQPRQQAQANVQQAQAGVQQAQAPVQQARQQAQAPIQQVQQQAQASVQQAQANVRQQAQQAQAPVQQAQQQAQNYAQQGQGYAQQAQQQTQGYVQQAQQQAQGYAQQAQQQAQGYVPQSQNYVPAPGAYDPNYAPSNPNPYNPYDPNGAAPVVAEKKKSRKKPLLIGIAALLVVALVGFGLWWFLLRDKGGDVFEEAVEKSLDSAESYVGQLPNLNKTIQVMEAIRDKEQMSGSFSYAGGSFSLGGSYNADLKNNKGRVDLTLPLGLFTGSGDGGSIDISAYLDEDGLQLSSNALLGADQALSLPLKNLGSRWNSSPLGQAAGVTLPADLSINLASLLGSVGDLDGLMEKTYGDTWTKFYDSVKSTEASSNRFGTGTCYVLSWDKDALNALASAAHAGIQRYERIFDGGLDDPQAAFQVIGDLDKLAAYGIGYLIAQAGPLIESVEFTVNSDGVMVGGWAKVHNGYNGSGASQTVSEQCSEVSFQLKGTNSPWELITLIMQEPDGDTSGYEIASTISGSTLKTTFTFVNYNGKRRVEATLVYNDNDGSFTMTDEDGDVIFGAGSEEGSMSLFPEGSGVRMSTSSMDYSYDYDTGDWEYKPETVIITMNPGATAAPLSGSVKDVLAMSMAELQTFVQNVQQRLALLQ